MGRIPVNDSNSEFARSYSLWEARTGLSGVRVGRILIAPFAGVTNLFDASYAAAVAVNAFGGRFYEPGPGRTYFGGLSTTF